MHQTSTRFLSVITNCWNAGYSNTVFGRTYSLHMQRSKQAFNQELIAPGVWKITEDDRFGQYPFMYVVAPPGADKVVLIDTGAGSGGDDSNIRKFLDHHHNPANHPYLVICTHVHFDHIGGAGFFPKGKGVIDVCMGGADRKFSENWQLTSLAAAHGGAKVLPFTVTRWLNDGERIYLNDKVKSEADSLVVLTTPGHTSDSISLYHPGSKRLFVGDVLYPWTALHLDSLGSSVDAFLATLAKLRSFINSQAAGPPPSSLTKEQEETLGLFLAIIDMNRSEAESKFDVVSFMKLNDWNTENAMSLYMASPGDAAQMAPPVPGAAAMQALAEANAASSSSSKKRSSSTGKGKKPEGVVAVSSSITNHSIKLCCGHVEASLAAKSIDVVEGLVHGAQVGSLKPLMVLEDGYGEYTSEDNGQFTVIMKIPGK